MWQGKKNDMLVPLIKIAVNYATVMQVRFPLLCCLFCWIRVLVAWLG
jgi:hypothetical protein